MSLHFIHMKLGMIKSLKASVDLEYQNLKYLVPELTGIIFKCSF